MSAQSSTTLRKRWEVPRLRVKAPSKATSRSKIRWRSANSSGGGIPIFEEGKNNPSNNMGHYIRTAGQFEEFGVTPFTPQILLQFPHTLPQVVAFEHFFLVLVPGVRGVYIPSRRRNRSLLGGNPRYPRSGSSSPCTVIVLLPLCPLQESRSRPWLFLFPPFQGLSAPPGLFMLCRPVVLDGTAGTTFRGMGRSSRTWPLGRRGMAGDTPFPLGDRLGGNICLGGPPLALHNLFHIVLCSNSDFNSRNLFEDRRRYVHGHPGKVRSAQLNG
jgi:hypothetical protein